MEIFMKSKPVHPSCSISWLTVCMWMTLSSNRLKLIPMNLMTTIQCRLRIRSLRVISLTRTVIDIDTLCLYTVKEIVEVLCNTHFGKTNNFSMSWQFWPPWSKVIIRVMLNDLLLCWPLEGVLKRNVYKNGCLS